MTDIRYFAVRYRLGLQDSESLVRLANALLDVGRNTPAVIQLFILKSPIMAEAGPLFERACAELNIEIPTKTEAIDELLRHHLESIVSGTCKAREGLEAVIQEIYYPYVSAEPCKEYVGDSRGMEHLVGDYWSYDDLMERPHEISCDGKYGEEAIACWEEYVRHHARDWLAKHERVD